MRLVVVSLALGLSACASVDPRPAFDQTADQFFERSGLEASWPRSGAEDDAAETLARELLSSPLDADRAARIALLRNRALLAELEELGVAQADYAQATRVANPTLSASRRTPNLGSGTNVEIELAQDLLDVLIQPARKRLAAVELEATKLRLGQTMLDLIAETRAAYFELAAAEEAVDLLVVARDLAVAAAELARRQNLAGNLEERQVALLAAAEAEAVLELQRFELERGAARERLQVLLGLSSAEWSVVVGHPDLPAAEPELADLEARALESRLDLGAARFGLDLVGRALALKKGTRYLPLGVEVGVNREKETDGLRLSGPRISIALPVFDTGAATIARLEAEERRARRQYEQLRLEIGAEVRLARAALLGARALVETFQRVLLPSRKTVLDQTMLSYNMMLLGVYDLLEARHREVEAELGEISARRDYWLARTRLERAVGSRLEAPRPLGGEQ